MSVTTLVQDKVEESNAKTFEYKKLIKQGEKNCQTSMTPVLSVMGVYISSRTSATKLCWKYSKSVR